MLRAFHGLTEQFLAYDTLNAPIRQRVFGRDPWASRPVRGHALGQRLWAQIG
jgi:hypothetical protein